MIYIITRNYPGNGEEPAWVQFLGASDDLAIAQGYADHLADPNDRWEEFAVRNAHPSYLRRVRDYGDGILEIIAFDLNSPSDFTLWGYAP